MLQHKMVFLLLRVLNITFQTNYYKKKHRQDKFCAELKA